MGNRQIFVKGTAFGGWFPRGKLPIAMKDRNKEDKPEENARNYTHTFNLSIGVWYAFLGVMSAIFGISNFPDMFKLLFLLLVVLIWIFFELNQSFRNILIDLVWKRVQQPHGIPDEKGGKAKTLTVRHALGGLLLLFLLGWGYEKCIIEPPPPAMVYYMVVLDASDAMKEPFDVHPSKWIAVREAFQDFYDRSHPVSSYGLVLIGGQNPQEDSGSPCSQLTTPLIPLVSESGKALPHRKLTLPKLQEQIK